MTSQTETTLLTHMLALCLRIDDHATDTVIVASDLRMSSVRYVKAFSLFRLESTAN